MALTPVEIRHVKLGRGLTGYRRTATDRLLEEIVDSFEEVWRERADLQDKNERLESDIDRYMERVDLPPKFVIPGGTELSARLDVARAAVRRAERRVAELKAGGDLADDIVLTYLNRLSDAVYAMARFADEPEPELFEGRG